MERKRNPYQQGPEDTSVYGQLHGQVWSYFVQEKYGKTLEDYLYARNQPFTEKTTIQLGLQIFDRIREVHEAGYLYCDLKLNNVLIGDAQETAPPRDQPYRARLIDYGLARKYLDAEGEHLPNLVQRVFRGNVIFASKNLFNLDTPSRRDDLISLCYLLLYLIDGDL